MPLNVLFVGGAGNISLPCVTEAVAAGHNVSVFKRGLTAAELPPGVKVIAGDMTDAAAYRELGKRSFDVVCQFIVFTPAQMAEDIAQYVFISSASVYEKPPRHYVYRKDADGESLLELQPEQDRLRGDAESVAGALLDHRPAEPYGSNDPADNV
jgi:hypothetical protein